MSLRVGIGVDAHAFEEGVPLVLGGVGFESPRGLAGHSDGDVITHALIDAVLGAAGLGDIGLLFPSDASTPIGISSLDLLRDAVARVRAAGYAVSNADCVLIGEEPHISERRAEMVDILSAVVGAPVEPALLAWFAEHGRDLPWRRTRDPYAVLVSEVMLQQTQVERVVPRYLAWLERWPSVEALASAQAADVIREWQGLGYNRRGLNLHRAAQKIATEGWPEDLRELPGVGPYTAAAVENFALGREVLPVDTNVNRVQERTGRRFSAAAGQALMDLGATVCLARIPRCDVCPLASTCPSRGRRYEPLRKQSRFEGSFRQRRAQTLRLVAECKRALSELDREAVESLAQDGLVRVAPCGTFVTLP